MTTEHTISSTAVIAVPQTLPSLVAAGERIAWRFTEFFTATIRNPNTLDVYLSTVNRSFSWGEGRGLHDLPYG
jgi:hypothetical protein